MGFKSEKDREAFVQKLTAAGFGPEEIAVEVSGIEASTPAPAPVAPPIKPSSQIGGGTADATVAPPIAPPTPAVVQQQAAELTAAREPAGNTLSDQLFTADTAKLLAPAAAYGLYKGAQAIKDRMFSSERPQYPTGVEPTMGVEPEAPKTKLPLAAQQQTVFTPKEAAVAGNITEKYPFSLQEAKTGLGIGDVRITDPTQAELVAKQYSKQLQERAAVPPTAPTAPATTAPITSATTAPVAPPSIVEAPAPATPAATQTVEVAAQEVTQEKKAKKPKHVQPPGTGAGDNWIHNLGGADFYKDVIRTQNNGKPINNMEEAYKAVNKYANEVGRYKPFKQGPATVSIEALEAARPKAGNFGKLPLPVVPPTMSAPGGGLGGRGVNMNPDPLMQLMR